MTVGAFDGDHQSPAETVIITLSRTAGNREAGLFDELCRNPFAIQKNEEMVPAVR